MTDEELLGMRHDFGDQGDLLSLDSVMALELINDCLKARADVESLRPYRDVFLSDVLEDPDARCHALRLARAEGIREGLRRAGEACEQRGKLHRRAAGEREQMNDVANEHYHNGAGAACEQLACQIAPAKEAST